MSTPKGPVAKFDTAKEGTNNHPGGSFSCAELELPPNASQPLLGEKAVELPQERCSDLFYDFRVMAHVSNKILIGPSLQ